MTLPVERTRSLLASEALLLDLLAKPMPPETVVRDRARAALRHFPTRYDIDQLAARSPEILDCVPTREGEGQVVSCKCGKTVAAKETQS